MRLPEDKLKEAINDMLNNITSKNGGGSSERAPERMTVINVLYSELKALGKQAEELQKKAEKERKKSSETCSQTQTKGRPK
ncbi:MAG: hypothetical protein ABIH99_01230 [Candidatus Micrarchaeota archaeon]